MKSSMAGFWPAKLCTVVAAWTLAMPSPGQDLYQPHPWRPPFGLERVGSGGTNEFEAEAIAFPESRLNPVDLGTVLVPEGWLLLGPAQTGHLEVAAISRRADVSLARIRAWFSSAPKHDVSAQFPLSHDRRAQRKMALPPIPAHLTRDKLRVAIEQANGTMLWEKTIPVMLVRQAPSWPRFGVTTTRLRFDAPISIRNADGSFSTLDYADAWDPQLKDVVVSLPAGARFVFWRGASYVPFWAGKYNTGLCYEWAETKPPADGYADCVEPLMDKELRYGRVEVIESSSARVHARWTYQSCDFNYKVWGDAAQEDFYFYPDGYGTRVLTLQSALDSDYELSEFIVLTPQDAYPLSVLPAKLIDILFLDGEKREITFPYDAVSQGAKLQSRDAPAVYRVRLHKDDPNTAIYFTPEDRRLPPVVFGPFKDGGQIVTPCYWGSHWPLARGQTTGGKINDRIHATPSHNSIMSWAMQRSPPLRETFLQTLDTLGRSRKMRVQTWAWLIGLTDAPDARLLEWAQSFSAPPSVEVRGARLEAESVSAERRALRLVCLAPSISMTLHPVKVCVNPVLEVRDAPKRLSAVTLNGSRLASGKWAWDGMTLWLEATLKEPATLKLDFARPTPSVRTE